MSDTNNSNNQGNNPYQNQQDSREMISSQNQYSPLNPYQNQPVANQNPYNQVNPYQNQAYTTATPGHTKFCKFCGSIIPFDAVVCTSCGRQVEELKTSGSSEKVVVNNINTNTNTNTSTRPVYYGREKNKWVAFLLCFFFGYLGAHKFYEGKILFGILYLFTFGFFGIGYFIDLIVLLLKPNPYYV